MQYPIKEVLQSGNWHVFYNSDGNQGPYEFKLTSFTKIDLADYTSDAILENRDKKEDWSFWLLYLDIVPLISNCFSTTTKISEDIAISDCNGTSYVARYDKPSFYEPGICEVLSLHKYNHSFKIPKCKCKASLLFHLPDSISDYVINYNGTPKAWYKPKNDHKNELPLEEVINSDSWYKCNFTDSPELDIKINISSCNLLPLSHAFGAAKDDDPFSCGYCNLEDSEFIVVSVKIVNHSKIENNDVGRYILGRLILVDDAGYSYAASGTAGSFDVDYTSKVLNSNVLLNPLTPKIKYNADIVYLVAKNISSLSIGLRYGTLVEG